MGEGCSRQRNQRIQKSEDKRSGVFERQRRKFSMARSSCDMCPCVHFDGSRVKCQAGRQEVMESFMVCDNEYKSRFGRFMG